LGTEVALGFFAGLASFAVVSLAVIAGNSDGLVIATIALCIAAVGAMFRFWGVEYAVPAALAAVLAFDWFYIPPTHSHAFPDAENLANLVAALAVAVLVGELAAHAGRRADVSELARSELADEQAALRRVATLVAEGVAGPQLMAAVAREAGTLLDVDGAWIEYYEGEEVVTAAQWSKPGKDPPTFDRARVDEAPVAAAVRRTGRVARIDDSEDVQPRPILARRPGNVSLVGAPISVEGAQWGLLLAWSQDSPLPDDVDQQLTHFTDLVATAIGNSDARAEVSRLADQQAALRRVATLVARGMSPERLLPAVCDELQRLLGVEEFDMARAEGDGTLTVIAFGGRDVGEFPVGRRLPVEGRNTISLVVETERPARIDDYSTATGPAGEIAKSAGIRGAVGCPIVIQGRLWGVAVAGTRGEEPLPADSEERIAEFTDLVATAIANAEHLAQLTASRARVVATADETRRRIERDLHDGAQQRLVSLRLALRAVQTTVPPQLGDLEDELAQVADGLEGVLDELREMARGIHPAILAKGGLAPALKTLARRWTVPVELDVRVVARLPERVEVATYYVVSEALTNAAKHAQASLVNVEVETVEGALRLCVRDDGVGGADPIRGSGLVGLKDRVEALGGAITIHSPPGSGTTLRVELPLSG